MELEEEYWSARYKQGNIQWDIGHVSTPIKEYVDQLENKNLKILIPGSGNAYEAAYCHDQGFNNVSLVDISIEPINNFMISNPTFPSEYALHKDFFLLEGKYDLILEQTFFCALHPSQRTDYVNKMSGLLHEGGKLVGVLFDLPLNDNQPPFGGNQEIYKSLFETNFVIHKMEKCNNSILPRAGNELFFQLIKK